MPVVITVLYGFWNLRSMENTSAVAFVSDQFQASTVDLKTLFAVVPIVIFAFAGFELLFSLVNFVKNAFDTVGKAIFTGFFLVTLLYTLYQFFFMFVAHDSLPPSLQIIITVCVGLAAYGVAYNSIFAQYNNLRQFITKNMKIPKRNFHFVTTAMPIFIICLTVLFYVVLFFFKGFFILQQLSATGTMTIYTLLIIAYIKHLKHFALFTFSRSIITLLGIGTIGLMFFASIRNALLFGV